ncbi:MAG TPA: TetR/AcrR family transcriptional regulator [Streptosporangiaceae bacterium]|jgi:AcrR family transcriptional regulator
MSKQDPGSSRDRTRAQLVEVAADLLASQGPAAVTTRSVALAAGVQAPTIYRLFGDKSGLLDAVVQYGFASYLAGKHPVTGDDDPVENLRTGWELHVGFGLANPELFRLMHTALRTADGRANAAIGAGVLQARVHRVAEAGRLRVTERRAVDLIHAVGTGVVFALIDQAADERDDTLADTAWGSVCAIILTAANADPSIDPSSAPSSAAITNPATAAVTLRAALPDLTALTATERALLGDWLDRIADSQHARGARQRSAPPRPIGN